MTITVKRPFPSRSDAYLRFCIRGCLCSRLLICISFRSPYKNATTQLRAMSKLSGDSPVS